MRDPKLAHILVYNVHANVSSFVKYLKIVSSQDGGCNVNLRGILRFEHTLVANDQARFRVIFYAVSYLN